SCRAVTLRPDFWSSGRTTPSLWFSRAANRCASLVTGLPRRAASAPASRKASWALMVSRSGLIIGGFSLSDPAMASGVPDFPAELTGEGGGRAERRGDRAEHPGGPAGGGAAFN